MANWTWESVLTRAAARVGIAVAVALAAVAVASPALAGNPAADIDQCSNGKLSAPTGCAASGDWVNGNLNENNSHYREGDSVPFPHEADEPDTRDVVQLHDRLRHAPGRQARLRLPHLVQPHRVGCQPVRRVLTVRRGSGRLDSDRPVARVHESGLVAGRGSDLDLERQRHGRRIRASRLTGSRAVVISFTATASTVVVAWGGHIGVADRLGSRQQRGRDQRLAVPHAARKLQLRLREPGPLAQGFRGSAGPADVRDRDQRRDRLRRRLLDGHRDARRAERPGHWHRVVLRLRAELASNPDCTFGGTSIGSSPLISSSVQSPAFVPQQPGRYCIRAEYAPDAFAPYSPGVHTNQTTGGPNTKGECFEVVIPTATLTVIKHVSTTTAAPRRAATSR